MKQPKFNAIVYEVGGSSRGIQTLGGNDLPITSSEESPRTGNVGVVPRDIVWTRALWRHSAAIRPEMVVADQHTGCEQQRARLTPPYPGQVYESVQELLRYDRQTGIELAVENGNHVCDLPILDEMRPLLDLWHKAWYGYQYGREHVPTVTVSGIYGHEEWLNHCIKVKFGMHRHATAAIKGHSCRQRPISHWKYRRLNPLRSNKRLEFLYD